MAMEAKHEFGRLRKVPGILRGAIAALLLVMVALAPVCPVAAQKKSKQKVQKLEKSYQEFLDRDAVYFITREERNSFLKLTSDDERDQFIQNFWELRNPTPGSAENKFKDEVYERISYANSHFAAGANEEGWRTDRGRAYITLGPPQQKEVHYNASNLFPLEVWFYSYNHPSLPPFFYIMFYKHEGFGDFRFYSPFVDGPDKLTSGTEYINDRQGSIRAIQDSVGPLVARLSQSLIPGEPIDPSQDRPSLQSDAMLATVKGLADNPFTKQELNRRRALVGTVSARLMIPGQNLDVAILPLRDARGLTRLDYAMRFRQASDLSLEPLANEKYAYNLQAEVRVYDSEKNNQLIFSRNENVHDTIAAAQFKEIKDSRFGFEGTLPLPPGKFHIEFILTDWKNKKALQADKDVVIPEVDPVGVTVAGVLPFSAVKPADPAIADITPFTLAGLTFVPLGTNPLTFTEDQPIKIAYQIWARPQDPANYSGQKMTVEYGVGRPAIAGASSTITEDISKEQFDPSGSLVSGKELPLADRPPGAYLLSVAINQPGSPQHAASTMPFAILPGAAKPDVWDLTDPALAKAVETGLIYRERAQCLLEEGKADDARQWFRLALSKNHQDEISRERLVEAYSARKDYAAIQSLYKDVGITEQSDTGTILRIAEGLDRQNGTLAAIELLESALASRQDSGALYIALAEYYRKNGDVKKAAEAEAKGKPLLGVSSSK
jgi:GWxTD domain-containing protein